MFRSTDGTTGPRALWAGYVILRLIPAAIFFFPIVCAVITTKVRARVPVPLFLVGLVASTWLAWRWWATWAPRWRLWAFANVADRPPRELRDTAVRWGLVWPPGHPLGRKERGIDGAYVIRMYAAQLAGVFLAAKSGGVLERMRADMIPFIFDETGKTYFPMGISKAGEYLDELDPRMADRARDVLEGLLMMLYR